MNDHIGLVGNIGGQYPTADEFRTLNPGYFRTILYRTDDLKKLQGVLPSSTKLIVVLNNEHEDVHGDEWDGLDEVAFRLAAQYGDLVEAIEVGNELDLLGHTPQFAADRAAAVANALFATRSRIKVLLSSVASRDWVTWLKQASLLAATSIDGVCLHPYGAAAGGFPSSAYLTGDLRDKILTAHDVSGKLPVFVTEMGVKLAEVGGEANAAEWTKRAFNAVQLLGAYVCPAACLFAYHDANGAPFERGGSAFGMIEDGTQRKRPVWDTFASLTSARPFVPPLRSPSVTPPKTPTWHVGDGVRTFVERKGLVVTGPELYFNDQTSSTPTDKGLVFWIASENAARFVAYTQLADA